MHSRLLVLTLAAYLAPSFSAQTYVPGDYANLQTAIDAASPGDVIVVTNGGGLPIVIDKPLTILGGLGPDLPCEPHLAGITLAGSSGGTVVISGYKVASLDCNYPAAGIVGGGFDELHLIDSEIELSAGHSGLGHGNDAIRVDVPLVVITSSTIQAAGSDHDDWCGGYV